MQNPLLKSRPIPDQLTPGQLTANPKPPTQPDPATPKPAGKGVARSSRPVRHWLAAGPGGSFEFEWVLADLGGPGEDHDRAAVPLKPSQPGSPPVTKRTRAPCMRAASSWGGAEPIASVTPGSASASKKNGTSRQWKDRPAAGPPVAVQRKS